MKKLVLASAAFLCLLSSCKKESGTVIPNPDPGSTASQKQSSGGCLHWTSASINPAKIKFQGKINHVRYEQEATNSGTINMYSPIPLGFNNFTLPTGPWQEVTLTLTLDNTNTAPAMTLNGYFMDNNSPVPVMFKLDEDLAMSKELRGVSVNNNTLAAYATGDMETYTDDITPSEASSGQTFNGTVVISSTSNTSMYNSIVGKMKGN